MTKFRYEPSGWLKNSLGLFQILIGLGALLGGWMLITDPTGGELGMSLTWLKGTPFSNFLIPGVVLFTINGLGTLAGSVCTFKCVRFSGETAIALGVFMMLWISIQVSLIGYMNFLQPLYFTVGILETTGGWFLREQIREVHLQKTIA